MVSAMCVMKPSWISTKNMMHRGGKVNEVIIKDLMGVNEKLRAGEIVDQNVMNGRDYQFNDQKICDYQRFGS
jgi:hypothetical protein